MLTNNAYGTEVAVKSWKELRDQHIVKQNLDYSCGAASFQNLAEAVKMARFYWAILHGEIENLPNINSCPCGKHAMMIS